MMKVSNLVTKRFKETPADCQIASQALMVRGGYIKNVGNGIYTLSPITKRITKKVEAIMREEMDAIDGQEVLFPVTMPATLWEESGRYTSIGSEMLRFTDRSGAKMCLGMTHEEAAVQYARGIADSYNQYPFMIYQIQTKFRDEPRCRGGLIRVREFTMKDAYSFHTSQADLEAYYQRCYDAYHRIFARCGVPEVVAVCSDSGMMGGKISHEYMLLTDIGEDSIVLCNECDYRANMEAAPSLIENETGEMEALRKVDTPAEKTIEDLCDFLHIRKEQTCKAVIYQRNEDDSYVLVFIRGDLEVNETKLRNYLKAEIHPALVTEESGITPGFVGPIEHKGRYTIVFDRSLKGIASLATGANEVDKHYVGFNIERDFGAVEYVDVAKAVTGGICPVCGKKALRISRGIEVGNIFQLGDKYTKSMGMTYVDADGALKTPIMGCYGIGVGRLVASVCEVRHDDYGPIWPISIAPWQVHLCAMRVDKPEVREAADALYDKLQKAGVEVIYDDRAVSAGVMFSDADLLGVPVRVVVSPKTLARGAVEVSARDKSFRQDAAVEYACEEIQGIVKDMLSRCSAD